MNLETMDQQLKRLLGHNRLLKQIQQKVVLEVVGKEPVKE